VTVYRDPDLGRDRTTAALGRRDWGWYVSRDGLLPAEREPGAAPWGSTRHVTAHDRYDRTLGIPPRSQPMWPPETLPLGPGDPAGRAQALCDEILGEAHGPPAWPPPERALPLLHDIAGAVYGAPTDTQRTLVYRIAAAHHVDGNVAWQLAGGVGAVVAQSAHRAADTVPGAPRLNILADANLAEALQLFAARDHIRQLQANSDPDLPRLWMLANGLAHGTPLHIMRTVPARTTGPAAAIAPLRDDLVDWHGMRVAVQHMRATVAAAGAGHRWLRGAERLDGDDAALAVGVISLTDPKTAATLARLGLRHVTAERANTALSDPPAGVLDLSDSALKAICDRNGWLLGAPSERTQRELVQRSIPADAADTLRVDLAAGQGGTLPQIVADNGPDDADLDRRAYRKNPPSPDVTATTVAVRAGALEALRRFAGLDYQPRAGIADALVHRFPAQFTRAPLAQSADQLLADPQQPAARKTVPSTHLTLDLGL